MPYQLLADAVLVLHLAVILFVVGGLLAIVAGNLRGWRWVNGWPFRLLHLAAIAVVVGQAWLGRLCPLTTLESWLRARAGSPGYDGSFIEHWVQRIIFYEAPAWIFTAAYTAFGLMVVVTWSYFPPRRKERP
jgi:Protein of Unknown function (DUF2784)